MTQSIRIDFHSHCLPGIDDGAAHAQESVGMLRQSLRQGIRTIVATPHFYDGAGAPEAFLRVRDHAMAVLQQEMACAPELSGRLRLIPGAEVLLRRGIGRVDLRPLCIRDTNAVLLELPLMTPQPWVYDELEDIALGQRLTVILAHVDRYRHWYSSAEIARLTQLPDAVVQLNAEAFLDPRAYRRLRRWLPRPDRLVLGSDMHHLHSRPPNIGPACQKMRWRRRCGQQWLAQMAQTADELLYPPLL